MRRSARIGCGLAIAVLLAPAGSGWTRLAAAQSGATAGNAASTPDGATVYRAKPGTATATRKAAPAPASMPTATKKTVTPNVASTTAKQAATTAKKPVTATKRPAAVEDRASRTPAERDSLAHPRTLDEINIQGEIPVPQVLFITARDQRRFLDFQHRRYLKNSQRVGETTVLPSWIAVTPGARPQEPPR